VRKNYIAGAVIATVLTLNLFCPIRANAEVQKVAIIEQGGKTFVPIKAVTEKMGGNITRKEEDKAYFFSINGKTVRLDDNIPFGSVDGQFAPFETRDVRGYKVPVFNKAIYKDGDIYVPINFLTDSVGLKLEAKDGQVAFDDNRNKDDNSNNTVVTLNPNSGSSSNSQVVESNRPVTKPTTPTNNGGNTSGSTTTPTQPTTQPSGGTTTPTQTEPPKAQPTKTYTGSQVKQKLYGLGFFDYGGGMAYNIYGKDGLSQYTYLSLMPLSGTYDMSFTIKNSNPEIDQKIKTILGYILPTESGKLYSILDNPQLKAQTLTMDGRSVEIMIESYGIVIAFGPIAK
jgi:hypothetical protein